MKCLIILFILGSFGCYATYLLHKEKSKYNFLFLGFILLIFTAIYSVDVLEYRIGGDNISVEKMRGEFGYLETVNKILKLGNKAISTGSIEPYLQLKSMRKETNNQDVIAAIEAEIMRIDLMYTFWDDSTPEDIVWNDSKNGDILIENLIDLFNNEKDVKKRLKILTFILDKSDYEGLPDLALSIARKAKHVKEYVAAISCFQSILGISDEIEDYSLEQCVEWWEQPLHRKKWFDSLKK